MAPVIGIPLGLDDRERWKPGRRYLYLDHSYVGAVERAGGVPILLPMQAEPAALVERIDALLLPGGDDFLPDPSESRYPESVAFDPAPAEQVDFDRGLLEAALGRGIPILGVCYGAQLIALHAGGTIHHHLPIDVPASIDHRLPERDGRHPIHPEPGSRLAGLVGDAEIAVNSLHHQAIADPGIGLRIAARAPDGVVEAVEASDGSFLVGVHWHPVRLSGPAGEGLVEALVAACRQR